MSKIRGYPETHLSGNLFQPVFLERHSQIQFLDTCILLSRCCIVTSMQTRSHKRVIELIRKQGVIRSREVAPMRISRAILSELTRSGVLRRDGRGLYSLVNDEMSEHRSLAEVAKRVPKSVVCLLSALRFHNLTVQNPHEIWIAIEGRAWKPLVDNPPVRVFRFTGKAWSEGVEHHVIDGVPVAVT